MGGMRARASEKTSFGSSRSRAWSTSKPSKGRPVLQMVPCVMKSRARRVTLKRPGPPSAAERPHQEWMVDGGGLRFEPSGVTLEGKGLAASVNLVSFGGSTMSSVEVLEDWSEAVEPLDFWEVLEEEELLAIAMDASEDPFLPTLPDLGAGPFVPRETRFCLAEERVERDTGDPPREGLSGDPPATVDQVTGFFGVMVAIR